MESEGRSPTFRVLGPLEAQVGESFRLSPGRQQIVLTMLLLEANRVVGTNRLIEAIWDGAPPATARVQVQICVSALRNILRESGWADALVTRAPGYLLRVPDDELDARLFARLTADADVLAAQGNLKEATRVLREAIGLWRGPALDGIHSRLVRARAAQLDESLLLARETSFDLAFRVGDHHTTIGDIAALLQEHPLRERLRGQYMLALYRSGRRAEALEAYRVGRELMIEELGIEPGAELRELESAMLSDAHQLLTPRSAATRAEPEVTPVPRQLPADIADFTGHADLVARVRYLLVGRDTRRAAKVVVLTGKPGVGKSTLGVHVAHALGETDFPDGQLYCQLGGTGPAPADPADVLGRFLRALGVPVEGIPETLGERATLFRHLLADSRSLIVLDDAASESQVRHLLPGSGNCAVVVTSRVRLTGLAGAKVLEVDVLAPAQAVRMLVQVVGQERVAAEPAAADALVRLVDRLPLALRIISARLAARPTLTLSWMLERLSDEQRRLDELSHGEMVVRASVALTYDSLDPQARELMRLLGALAGATFPAWVAAALLGVDLDRGTQLVEHLVDMQMIEIAPGDVASTPRYRFHGLLRLFARERLEQEGDDAHAAITRVVGGWLGLARGAHTSLYGRDNSTVLHGSAERWPLPRDLVDRLLARPLSWLEAERDCLCGAVDMAVAAGLDEHAWDLAVTLVALFEARLYHDHWERTHTKALEAVRATGNRRGEAALLCSLGSMHLSGRKLTEALWVLRPALATFTELDEVHGMAIARRNLALVNQMRGEDGAARRGYERACAEFATVGDVVGQAHVWVQIAALDLAAGDIGRAEQHLLRALALCPPEGSRRVENQLRFRLSELLMRQARHQHAAELLNGLLDTVRVSRDLMGQVRVLHRLGTVNAVLGKPETAARVLREALDLAAQAVNTVPVDGIRLELAAQLRELGRHEEAARVETEDSQPGRLTIDRITAG
ncbi:DNA-binding SARP family transcriptional activator [Actinokineospora baliensis]|uniref:AfsR/SARP family transcriptional regulator n=1 Tax=Actinokineospora baliensis TaxID=547056 RepID=UPI001959BE27|nr:AfsR/SARP family transcriptional regulator [Actinokineospora baliensis]MBM7776037.1 DNA-binding SARP family transcriptional activator [Actinokineospora baliensis]